MIQSEEGIWNPQILLHKTQTIPDVKVQSNSRQMKRERPDMNSK